MRIIISPAKRMDIDTDSLIYKQLPCFIKDTEVLLNYLKKMNFNELKTLWNCNDNIARLNYERIQYMDLYHNLTPAILSFNGIQYQYMSQRVLEIKEYEYLEKHLRILSGFYGILKPFDGVTPYRLEMQAKLKGKGFNSLYEFWNKKLADKLFSETSCIINLASKEYSKCITKYLNNDIRFITCTFGEFKDNKIIEKGTLVKMARGEMVKFLARKQIIKLEEIKQFNSLNYTYIDELSDDNNYVFIKP